MGKNNKRHYQIHVIYFLLFLPHVVFGFENWWQCSGKTGGEWNFARTPSVCLVDHMQTQSFVKSQYSSLIFNDSSNRTSERNRYMTEFNATTKETVRYYLLRRKPNVSEAEIEAFFYGLQALMHQETYWSHYRQPSDGKVRYMRGDVGHGHGVMQVDDRSHQTVLLKGYGADLVNNLIYGLDVFYSAWEKAPLSSCLKSPTNYKDRIRSAWAAYNGGPSKICRWTSQTGTYAAHDKDFLAKMNAKKWQSYITDQNKKSSIDVACLTEGNRPCAPPSDKTEDVIPAANKLYKNQAGSFCLFKNDHFECIDQLNDVNCLQVSEGQTYSKAYELSDVLEKRYPKIVLDRHKLCLGNIVGLIPVSSFIRLNKTINMRKTPAGELIKAISIDKEFQVLDFEVLTTSGQERYYKIREGSSTGYVYAGDIDSYPHWAQKISALTTGKLIANEDDTIKIIAPSGINLRKLVGGTLLETIPKNTELKVLQTIIQGTKNYLYYKVSYKNKTGYIYSGYINSPGTSHEWTQVVAYNFKQMQLAASIPYRFLSKCASTSCAYSTDAVRSKSLNGSLPDLLIILEVSGLWSLVENIDGSKSGWIKTEELEDVNN